MRAFIEEALFFNCVSLTNIYIPDGIVKVEDAAFASCTNLEYIRLPETLITIEEAVFQNCDNLDNLVIPKSVKNLDFNAFDSYWEEQKIICIYPELLNSNIGLRAWYELMIKQGLILKPTIDILIKSGKSFREVNDLGLIVQEQNKEI